MMLVGNVKDRTTILIDDLADTSNTITRAAKLLKKEGATQVYALLTHGILSGDAIDRINASALDKVVVTNSVDQADHARRCPKLEVLEVGNVFAEVSTFSCLCHLLPCSSYTSALCDFPQTILRLPVCFAIVANNDLGNPESAPRREYQCVVRLQLRHIKPWIELMFAWPLRLGGEDSE